MVFIDHDGTRYVVTGRAEDPETVVIHAQQTINYLNRVGPIQTQPEVYEIDPSEVGPGFGFVMTTPDGQTLSSRVDRGP